MNNRPLFWAVMCFALGEVIYIVADRGSKIGTAFVVLIFAVFLIRRTKLSWRKKLLYPLMLVLGFSRICWADYVYAGNQLYGAGEYKQSKVEYENYSVSYGTGVLDQDYYGKGYQHLKSQVELQGVGIVDNVAKGSRGHNLTLKLKYSTTEKVVLTKEYKIIIYGVEQELDIGDKVSVNGAVKDFVPSNNPGEFNRRSYYKAREIVGFCTGGDIKLEPIEDGNCEEIGLFTSSFEDCWYKIKKGLYKLREQLNSSLYDICQEDIGALYAGILLGEREGIPDQDMLLYRLMGIAHIFAISGLHIGIVGGFLYKLLRRWGLNFSLAAGIAMTVTLMYGVMTGFSFSTIRAVVMLGLSLGGEVLGRRYDMLTGMGLALGVLLIVEPYRIMDGGLILSFGAVAGVALSRYIIKLLENNKSFRRLKKKRYRFLYSIVTSFIFSTGISLVTTPLVAYMYFQIPMYSVILNMVVVPLMTITVYCGMIGILVGLISPFLGKLIVVPGAISLRLYKLCCKVLQLLPMDVVNTGKPDILEIIIYYVVLLVALVLVNPQVIAYIRKVIHSKTKKWITYMRIRWLVNIVLVVILTVGMLGIAIIRLNQEGERITFIDVGQGDGVLISTESGVNMVIDMGSSSNDSLGQYVVYPALLTEHRGHVDYWFITHFDKDHASGLEYIISSQVHMGITIDNLVVSENCEMSEDVPLLQMAREKGINIIYMKQGDYIEDESFAMEAIHPSDDFRVNDRNEQSLVLSYESKKIKVLFTGDIGEEAIMHMLEKGDLDKDYHVLKVPHHGSKYSYSMKFMEQINVEASVISCAAQNSYGHPHKETLEGIYWSGSDIYRTDYQGRILIIAD